MSIDNIEDSMECLIQTLIDNVPGPEITSGGSLQMQISALDYNSYVGVIGIGRVQSGRLKTGDPVIVANKEGEERSGRILQVLDYRGLERIEVTEAEAGDIISVSGISGLQISDTLCTPGNVQPLPPLKVDEPTISMSFQVNDSPFAGRDGKYITSRNLKERLERETLHNVALRVEDSDSLDKFTVSGRGELHLAVLIENMRREGYELSVGRPEVIYRDQENVLEEPFEDLVVDLDSNHQGAVMEELGSRKGILNNMAPDATGRVRLEYVIPTRGLIGFRSLFLTITSGTGVMSSICLLYTSDAADE